VRAALRQPVHARGRAGRGHGGGLKRRAGLGEAHEGERARGLHCRGLISRNGGGGGEQ
jgi:hypothetical protein